MYKTIFGPVPSRRLGMSLGIDLTPHKTCSFDCIYCECGATTNLTNIRKNFVDSALVKNELLIFFEKNINNLPEILTFSGSGEPTLAKNLGEIINFCKKNFALPVCVLTNTSLINLEDVQTDLINADIVIPSLDAVSQDIFEKIDRPHNSIKIENIINGLINFRKKFKGKLYIEIVILKNINDSIDELKKISEIVDKIQPTAVQLNTAVRPGTIADIQPLSFEKLSLIAKLFNIRAQIVSTFKANTNINLQSAALTELLNRRYCNLNDLLKLLDLNNEQDLQFFLKQNNIAYQTKIQSSEKFYKIQK